MNDGQYEPVHMFFLNERNKRQVSIAVHTNKGGPKIKYCTRFQGEYKPLVVKGNLVSVECHLTVEKQEENGVVISTKPTARLSSRS